MDLSLKNQETLSVSIEIEYKDPYVFKKNRLLLLKDKLSINLLLTKVSSVGIFLIRLPLFLS